MTNRGLDYDRLDAAIGRLPNRALDAQRKRASASFQELGLPTRRDEDWRYTNLAPIAELATRALQQPDHAPVKTADSTPLPEDIDAHWLIVRNGELEPRHTELDNAVTAARLSDIDVPPDLIVGDALVSLNAALLRDAWVVHVQPGKELARPIGVLHYDDAQSGDLSSAARVLFTVGEGATADLIQVYRSGGADEHLANSVTEIHAHAGSTVRWLSLQMRESHHLALNAVTAMVDENARFDGTVVELGGRLSRSSLALDLRGRHANVTARTLAITDADQYSEVRVLADHQQRDGTSRQTFRGIAAGRSRAVFNSKALVRAGADGTDAEQSSHNLLLSDRAEIDTKPELEIYADDVKCAHGATIGQLDQQALFYLRTRGIDEDQAARMLTRAFASQIANDVSVPAAADLTQRAIDGKLDRVIGGGGR